MLSIRNLAVRAAHYLVKAIRAPRKLLSINPLQYCKTGNAHLKFALIPGEDLAETVPEVQHGGGKANAQAINQELLAALYGQTFVTFSAEARLRPSLSPVGLFEKLRSKLCPSKSPTTKVSPKTKTFRAPPLQYIRDLVMDQKESNEKAAGAKIAWLSIISVPTKDQSKPPAAPAIPVTVPAKQRQLAEKTNAETGSSLAKEAKARAGAPLAKAANGGMGGSPARPAGSGSLSLPTGTNAPEVACPVAPTPPSRRRERRPLSGGVLLGIPGRPKSLSLRLDSRPRLP